MTTSQRTLDAIDQTNWRDVINSWEGYYPGWYDWPVAKKHLPNLIARRERMIAIGELTPRPVVVRPK